MEGRIRREIRERGALPFARFMELALYDPQGGYYCRRPRLGPRGDYFTASDVGRHLGRCLARQIVEIDRLVGPFEPFDVLEFGAGRGLLARDLIDAMHGLDPQLASRLRLTAIDRSPVMREETRRRVPEARIVGPDEIGPGHRGLALAVELFDALPAHRVRRREGRLVEVRVGLDEQETFVEVETPPSAEVRAFAERHGAAAVEGSEAEVTLVAPGQLDTISHALERGMILVIDYGDIAERLYPTRQRGTLQAYHRHRAHPALLERIGEQDLTAHVNFSALIDRARETNLDVLGLTTQDRFLIANGILDVFERPDPAARSAASTKERLQVMQLIHPESMGRVFKVLLLAKRCAPRDAIAGLTDPFARED